MKKLFTFLCLTALTLTLLAQNSKQGTPVAAPGKSSTNRNAATLAKFNPDQVYATTCDTLNWPIAASWLPPVNYWTLNPADGWINGLNVWADKEKAQYFDASASPFTRLHGFFMQFGKAYSANPAKIVTFRIYDGTTMTPGATLGTFTKTMAQLMYDYNNNYYTEVEFQTSIALPASKRFFISVDVTGLTWTTNPVDTLSIVSNSHPNTVPSTVWEKWSDNTWHRYNTVGSWALDISMYIFPYITNQQTLVGFTPSPIPNVCSGLAVNYNAAPSLPYAQLLWNFPGGTPNSATTQAASVTYTNAGTYLTKLYVLGGGCPTLDSAQANVTVLQSPVIVPTAVPASICPSQTSTINVIGANSYTWTPASSLNASTGATVLATPTTTTTYTITGTSSNGCTGTGSVTVTSLPNPTASVSASSTNICITQNVTFNASASTNVTTYNWVFQGGTPATSTLMVPTITYNTAGSWLAKLYAVNSCGTDSSYSVMVQVGCTGENELGEGTMFSFLDQNTQELVFVNSADGFNGNAEVSIVNSLGQVVSKEVVNFGAGYKSRLSVSELAKGVYVASITADGVRISLKFMK